MRGQFHLQGRRGVTLLEVIVAVVIMAVLFGLTLGAIHRVRSAAAHIQSVNNLRQISLALQQYSDAGKAGHPPLLGFTPRPPTNWFQPVAFRLQEKSIFHLMLPYLDVDRGPKPTRASTQEELDRYFTPQVKVYQSPADPSFAFAESMQDTACRNSYVANIQAMDGYLNIPDGTSQTIAFSEHYFYTRAVTMIIRYDDISAGRPTSLFQGDRRATFADPGWKDVLPVVTPGQPTVSSRPGATFQYRPRVEDSDGRLPQTPHLGGLPVALFDGSVRTIGPGVSESTFWSLVTPNAGDIPGDY